MSCNFFIKKESIDIKHEKMKMKHENIFISIYCYINFMVQLLNFASFRWLVTLSGLDYVPVPAQESICTRKDSRQSK